MTITIGASTVASAPGARRPADRPDLRTDPDAPIVQEASRQLLAKPPRHSRHGRSGRASTHPAPSPLNPSVEAPAETREPVLQPRPVAIGGDFKRAPWPTPAPSGRGQPRPVRSRGTFETGGNRAWLYIRCGRAAALLLRAVRNFLAYCELGHKCRPRDARTFARCPTPRRQSVKPRIARWSRTDRPDSGTGGKRRRPGRGWLHFWRTRFDYCIPDSHPPGPPKALACSRYTT